MAGKPRKASNLLLLGPSMRDFASCFGNHAIKVSDGGSTGSSSGSNSSVVADRAGSGLSAVTCFYRARLSAPKDVLLRVTWSKANAAPLLSLAVVDDDGPRSALPWEINAFDSQSMTEKRGARSYISGCCAICLHWDISAARYESGPEPVDGFYVVVVVESELALLLGDLSRDFVNKLEGALPLAQCSTICRREQVLGHAHHSTRARFRDAGSDHEITIRCKGHGRDAKDSELSVSVDKKLVVHVRSLRWNFRGNQTIFIDGSPVDMMWDVHHWWFMFRTRSTLESRLWLEEEALNAEQGTSGFSLVIQAFRSP
ncbi:uncharacterized protein LOC122020900 [Zingiber officinale]|uniref:Uncharacterized protein n=1 Tax=Zingiber officinale TaxID=94328 RepID=A0A8J5F699_ZINOF|nr:uncharacterized protein LOC122020900 [Zingiber officinale]XP_042434880.1 uncharacterized protein LOC122020900 [Zingiber officinale]KAG6479926.1 hypothetical protein ZIOFF_063402 [Zingiber officinale]